MLKKLIIITLIAICNVAYADGFSKKLVPYSKNEKQMLNFAKAYQLLQSNDIAAAKDALQLQDPRYYNHHKHLELLAAIALKQNRPTEAIDFLLKITPQHRSQSSVLGMLAMAYYDAELYDLALANYNTLITKEGSNYKWWLGMATTLDAKGEIKAALETYTKVKVLGNLNVVAAKYVNDRIIAISNLIAG